MQEDLLKICIKSTNYSYHDGQGSEATADPAKNSTASTAAPKAEHTTEPTSPKGESKAETTVHHLRRLFAAAAASQCPEGKESIWASDLIHKAHILIFLIAVSHIIYAALSMALSMLAMRRWASLEREVQDGLLLPLPLGGLQRHHESGFHVWPEAGRPPVHAPHHQADLRRRAEAVLRAHAGAASALPHACRSCTVQERSRRMHADHACRLREASTLRAAD